jgi:electron transfer flavoprotein alpha subunit
MSGILVIADHVDGALRDVTLEAVAAAAELRDGIGGEIAVAVLGAEPAALAGGLALEGVDEVIAVPVGADAFNGETYRAAIAALVAERRPRVVVAGFTVAAMSWAPAMAAAGGHGFASDVVAARAQDGAVFATREFYGAKVRGELEFGDAETVVLLVRATAWSPAAPGGAPRLTEAAAAVAAGDGERHVEYRQPPADDIDICSADVILAIGRGVGEQDNVAQFEALADRLGMMLAGSRPLVDAGWLPAARQVGQSGRTVKPKVYVALGISGAVQHLAGMKSASTIIAVNTDPEAAIFQTAHYGAVVDMFDVVDELEGSA